MLGPYWTHERLRGRGLYGRLLQQSLHLCDKEHPIVIFTTPDNIPSQKGIEKAGFTLKGDWEVTTWMLLVTVRRESVSD